MCGLAGVIGRDLDSAGRLVRTMLHHLRHRGPDGEGLWRSEAPTRGNAVVLGHRRLSIIDLSAAAAQPMSSADGRLHVIVNGEIYNYLELREELQRAGRVFRTHSDTEVLLQAWDAWGRDTLDRVVGMFAFALLDESRRVLVLARDPFAIKPLYYAQPPGLLAFASEIQPLLEVPGVSRTADAGAVADFLERGVNNHEGRTLFADVREIPGAHFAEVSLDTPDVRPVAYWQPPERQTHDLPFPEAVEQFRSRLAESVRLHLRSDVPVGFLLSGGQDSTAVLAMARGCLDAHATLQTFSYRGSGGAVDEARWIDAARGAAGARGHDVRIRPGEFAADLAALVRSQGEPFGSPVIYAQRRLFQEAAAAGVKVVLDGQGADEYLAGYGRFLAGSLASLLFRHRYGAFAQRAIGFRKAAGVAPMITALGLRWPALRALRPARAATNTLANDRWLQDRGASLSPSWLPSGPDVLRQMLSASLRLPSIPWLMRYADRSAMAFSIENRVPFLTPRLVEFVLGLPEDHLIRSDGVGKHLLRTAMRGLVPDVIRERRERVGFHVPLVEWLRQTPGLVQLIERATMIPAVRSDRAMALHRRIADAGIGAGVAFEGWRLAMLAAWQETFEVSWA